MRIATMYLGGDLVWFVELLGSQNRISIGQGINVLEATLLRYVLIEPIVNDIISIIVSGTYPEWHYRQFNI